MEVEERKVETKEIDWKKQFIGQYHQTIDDKGRIVLPSSFRDILVHYYGGEFGINFSYKDPQGKVLVVFPLPVLSERLLKVSELASVYDNMERLYFYYSGAMRGTLDSQGRIVIPQRLRKERLNKNIVVHGRLDIILIWDEEYFENKFMPGKEKLEQIKEVLKSTGNLDLLI